MAEQGAPSAEDRIDEILRAEPPVERATLVGWTALAEWRKPGGELALVLLGRPEHSLLQLKGYLHSGLLNMVWGKYDESGQPLGSGE
jgi:hypothetical protein